jgi:hypothetical protein
MGRRLLKETFRVMGIILRYVELFLLCDKRRILGVRLREEKDEILIIWVVLMNTGYLALNYSRWDGNCDWSEWASGHCWKIFSSRKLQREDCL